MRILVACEESQAVAIAFRERGHESYSCDIQECSGGYSVGASANYATDENGKILSWNDPRTAKARSKTFPGHCSRDG